MKPKRKSRNFKEILMSDSDSNDDTVMDPVFERNSNDTVSNIVTIINNIFDIITNTKRNSIYFRSYVLEIKLRNLN